MRKREKESLVVQVAKRLLKFICHSPRSNDEIGFSLLFKYTEVQQIVVVDPATSIELK